MNKNHDVKDVKIVFSSLSCSIYNAEVAYFIKIRGAALLNSSKDTVVITAFSKDNDVVYTESFKHSNDSTLLSFDADEEITAPALTLRAEIISENQDVLLDQLFDIEQIIVD